MATNKVNTQNSIYAASAKDAKNEQTGVTCRMALMIHRLNGTSNYDNEGGEDEDDEGTNNARIRNKCTEEFNCFRQSSVLIPLYKADGSFGDQLQWWKKNQLKYPYLERLASLSCSTSNICSIGKNME